MRYALKIVCAAAFLVAVQGAGAIAADHQVLMKNMGADGRPMQFEPAFLKIALGDTVTFMPEDAGHNVEAITSLSPAGAEEWAGSLDRELTVTFSVEGLHAYKCPPHLEMGMVGLVQVGGATTDVTSLESAKLPSKAKSRMKALFKKAGVTLSE